MNRMVKLVIAAGLCLPALSCAPGEAIHGNVNNTTQADNRGSLADDSSAHQIARSNVGNPTDVQVRRFIGEGFNLLYPPTVHVSRKLRVTDFEMYTFTYREEEVLSLYVGNLPQMGVYGLPVVSENSREAINGLPCQRSRVFAIDGPTRTQVVIEFIDDRFWPRYLRFRYSNVSSDVERIAEGIIRSVQSQEAGTLPDPSRATADPARYVRLMTQYWERSLVKLKEFQGTNVNPFPDGQGDPKEQLDLAIRQLEERIAECRKQVTVRGDAGKSEASP